MTLVGKKLSEDEDYTVEYKNNVNVTDSAEVVITGIGNYSGELSRTFKITAKDISKCRVRCDWRTGTHRKGCNT